MKRLTGIDWSLISWYQFSSYLLIETVILLALHYFSLSQYFAATCPRNKQQLIKTWIYQFTITANIFVHLLSPRHAGCWHVSELAPATIPVGNLISSVGVNMLAGRSVGGDN